MYHHFQEFASHNDIQYIETSAKKGQNVEQAFMTLTAMVKDQYDSGVFTIADPPVKVSDDQNEHNSWLKTCTC